MPPKGLSNVAPAQTRSGQPGVNPNKKQESPEGATERTS